MRKTLLCCPSSWSSRLCDICLCLDLAQSLPTQGRRGRYYIPGVNLEKRESFLLRRRIHLWPAVVCCTREVLVSRLPPHEGFVCERRLQVVHSFERACGSRGYVRFSLGDLKNGSENSSSSRGRTG